MGSTNIDRVHFLIREVLSVDVPGDDTDLFDSGLVDSLALVSVIAEIEEEFGITIELEELDVERFRSVNRIAELVAETAPERNTDSDPEPCQTNHAQPRAS
jgi:acyl carrier protein